MKYKKNHVELECVCPPKKFKSGEIQAYRWVHSDIEHEDNFKPAYLIKPSRMVNEKVCDRKCAGLGLSLFNSEDNATKRLNSLLNRKKNFAKSHGNCIAKVNITPKDGVFDEPNRVGHFTLHESVSCDLKLTAKIVKTLKIGK